MQNSRENGKRTPNLSFDRNKILSKFQCGFRYDKSTLDQLVRLETYVRDAFASGEHVVAIFFDLHKAYDMWQVVATNCHPSTYPHSLL